VGAPDDIVWTTTPVSTADRIDAHVWRISAVVIVGTMMSILDTTIVNVALATLAHELHSTVAQIQWVITGYLLSLAAVIPITGWAARRRRAGRPAQADAAPAAGRGASVRRAASQSSTAACTAAVLRSE
jgi:MFS family permease